MNKKARVVYNFYRLFENEEPIKITHSQLRCTVNVAVSRKRCKIESLLLQTTHRKWYMANRIATIRTTFS